MLITLDRLTYSYPHAATPALCDVTLHVAEGEFLLLAGESGAGKSTLLRTLNGLVPHFYGGRIAGQVRVAGRDPVAAGTAAMSSLVGLVFQDPEAQMVADTVEDELAFAMENAGLPPALMRKRIEEVLDQLSIVHLRARRMSSLSGGERQRVAIGAVLTLQPRVLVLDEPTSQLDPQAAEEVLDTLVRLNHDLGLTIVLSEHRLERVVQHADHMAYLAAGGAPLVQGRPAEVLAQMPLAPPLAQVARALGWDPVPVSLKEARRHLAADPRFSVPRPPADPSLAAPPEPRRANRSAPPVLSVQRAGFAYGGHEALRDLSLEVRSGEVLALMGRNGAGKTTLLKLMVGLLQPTAGRVLLGDVDTRRLPLEAIVRQVGYVPQRPDVLLFADTVREELAFTRRNHGLPPEGPAVDALIAQLQLAAYLDRDSKDLSVGERQRVALAAILAAEPAVLLLDEPTRGMDYRQKAALSGVLRDLAAAGRAVVLATHDVELAAGLADRVALLGEGQVVVEGRAREVMAGSLVFASQVSKLFRDPRWVTPEDVMRDRGAVPQAPA
ncbi:MAG TPA: ATP-binding cassette domain-containing protein [Chloroflexia bacterium]|nr:ATP-binding cassette domain-containing protein [Chloroflexia bacterium]